MARPFVVFLILAHFALSALAGTSAEEILTKAKAEAMAGGKVVLLKFDSPGCKWCKVLDSFLSQPEVLAIFQRRFVIASLRVPDIAGNPGALRMLEKTGGMNQGTPFLAMLDGNGALLVNSVAQGGRNIGFPVSPEERSWFVAMLRKASSAMTDSEIELISGKLKDFKQ